MKIMRSLFLLVAIIIVSGGNIMAQSKDEMNIMSFNIRYDSPADTKNGYGWGDRKNDVVDLLKHYNPDLLGVQEAMKHQLDYLLEQLPEYSYIGVGRDGQEKGEYSAILYKKDKFQVIKDGTFWLSETPEKPSKAWDAAFPRIVTWGKFKLKSSGNEFFYYNTHFDHVGKIARVNSAKLILNKINKRANDEPLILTGDFNVTPDMEPYKVITSKLEDSRHISDKKPYGPEGTFSGFNLSSSAEFRRIDYVFVKKFKVKQHETIADFIQDKFPSDHLPVLIQVEF